MFGLQLVCLIFHFVDSTMVFMNMARFNLSLKNFNNKNSRFSFFNNEYRYTGITLALEKYCSRGFEI